MAPDDTNGFLLLSWKDWCRRHVAELKAEERKDRIRHKHVEAPQCLSLRA